MGAVIQLDDYRQKMIHFLAKCAGCGVRFKGTSLKKVPHVMTCKVCGQFAVFVEDGVGC